MPLERAARKNDPILHSHIFAGGLAGALLGLAIGGLIAASAIATGGATLLIVAGAAGTVSITTVGGSMAGEYAGSQAPLSVEGYITTGAATVFTGPGPQRQARMSDSVDCHEGESIADGSESVFVENWNAARRTDGTTCAGTIADGERSVLIGGDTVARAGTLDRDERPAWYRNTLTVVDWVGTAAGLVTGYGELRLLEAEAAHLAQTGTRLAALRAVRREVNARMSLQLRATGAALNAYGSTDLPGARIAKAGSLATSVGGLRLAGRPSLADPRFAQQTTDMTAEGVKDVFDYRELTRPEPPPRRSY